MYLLGARLSRGNRQEARMWLSLLGIVMVLSLGLGAGSLLASLLERNGPL